MLQQNVPEVGACSVGRASVPQWVFGVEVTQKKSRKVSRLLESLREKREESQRGEIRGTVTEEKKEGAKRACVYAVLG